MQTSISSHSRPPFDGRGGRESISSEPHAFVVYFIIFNISAGIGNQRQNTCLSLFTAMPGHFCGQVFCISYVVSRFVLVIVVWKTTTFEMTASPFWDFMSLLSLDVTVEMSKYKKKIITFRHCTRPVWALARCHNFSLSLYYSFLWEWMANMKSFGVRVHASTTFCSVGRFLFLHFHYDRAQPNTFMDCIWWTDSQSIWLTRLSDFHFGILAWCTVWYKPQF